MPLAYIIRKTIVVKTYADYPKYATPDNEMIFRILHLTPDNNRLYDDKSAQSVKKQTAENKTDNRDVYDVLDQICKDTDLYPYIKQHESNRDSREALYAIHSRFLDPNHVNATA